MTLTDTGAIRVGEPDPAVLDGATVGRRMKRALLATRPKFFTASILPVVLGTLWGYREADRLDWGIFLLALVATVLVHAASNVWNDVGDDITGSDQINDDRIHPYTGGSRFIQNGVLHRDAMLRLSLGLWVTAVVAGSMLIWQRGAAVLGWGLAGALLGYLYSSPAVRLSGRGLGEAAVAVAFGILPVCGAAWLQSGALSGGAFLLAIPVSCWVADILLVNEVPDAVADGRSGKRTLAVRLGVRGTASLYAALQLSALAASGALVLWHGLSSLTVIGAGALTVIGLLAAARIWAGSRSGLKQAIEMTLAVHALGCLWLAGWVWAASG